MTRVLCGLECFRAAAPTTAAAVAQELTASLDPALGGTGCIVEVYRLELLARDEPLKADETVLCQIPSWGFDFESVEKLHSRLEELSSEHQLLLEQHARTKEALVQLDALAQADASAKALQTSLEQPPRRLPLEGIATEASAYPIRMQRPSAEVHTTEAQAAASGLAQDSRTELQKLRQQLALSERNQQETKATVVALRSEFMHLVEVWSEATPSKTSVPRTAAREPDKLSGSIGSSRPRSQPPQAQPGYAAPLTHRPYAAPSTAPYGPVGAQAMHHVPQPQPTPRVSVRMRGPSAGVAGGVVHAHHAYPTAMTGLRPRQAYIGRSL